MKLYEELEWRESVAQISDEKLKDVLNSGNSKFYLGIDPTGDGLHVGHLFGLINCKRLQMAGHTPILLVGGATGMIGDPSGKSAERNLLTKDDIDHNVRCIKAEIEKFVDAKIVNNYDWTVQYDVITFLRDVGKYFNINNMLAKESVKSRLENGISFTEFTYQVLQGLDYLKLYQAEGVTLQVGGTEQWGNIIAGMDLIRKVEGHEVETFGFNWPLITKRDGTKFGKTESGAVWLSPEKTSPYEFYQFWFNTQDADVMKYLKQFTFLSVEQINEIEESFKAEPHRRVAQKSLAEELTKMVHGDEGFEQALNITQALFSGNIQGLNAKEIEIGFGDVLAGEINEDMILVDALITAGLAKSKRESREFINGNAVSVNGDKVTDLEHLISKGNAIEGKFTVLRRGKKKYAMLRHV